MKLCRFELLSDPGTARSGLVYSGKIYETDGEEPKAVHEAKDVRPLPPIGRASAVRLFRWVPGEEVPVEPMYTYTNPNCVVGPSQILPRPDFAGQIDFEPYLAAIAVQDGMNLSLEEADDLILGFTLLNVLVARDMERTERAYGRGAGRSFDLGAVIGPVLTTPDEVEDHQIGADRGRAYQLQAVARVNGVDRRRGETQHLPFTFAEMIRAASLSCPIRAGDVFAMGPIVELGEPDFDLSLGDEVQVSVEKLGAIALKIGS